MILPVRVRVVVIDGITIGHPCCAVHGCQENLERQTDRFCKTHKVCDKICSVVGCSAPVVEGHLACADQTHRQAEERHLLHAQSRVRRPNIDVSSDVQAPIVSFNGEELFDIDSSNRVVQEDVGPDAHPSAPARGHKRLRAQFGRRRSHNEQLIVAPCGVIIARVTFFGAEAVSSVRVGDIILYFLLLRQFIYEVFLRTSSNPCTELFPLQNISSSTTIANSLVLFEERIHFSIGSGFPLTFSTSTASTVLLTAIASSIAIHELFQSFAVMMAHGISTHLRLNRPIHGSEVIRIYAERWVEINSSFS